MECCTVYVLYMSSEDSDYEETEEPTTGESERKLACYIIKMLPWEKTSLTSLKSRLDHALTVPQQSVIACKSHVKAKTSWWIFSKTST